MYSAETKPNLIASNSLSTLHSPTSGSKSESILFIGPKRRFSECLCLALVQEFPGCGIYQCDNAETILYDNQHQNYNHIALVLIDELVAEQALEHNGIALRHIFPFQILAIASSQGIYDDKILNQHHEKSVSGSILPMNLRLDSWLSAVRLMLSGSNFIPANLVPCPPQRPKAISHENNVIEAVTARKTNLLSELTQRENEVLALVASGMQNKIIAIELDISQHTVKLHIHHIITKLGVHNRTQASEIYHRQHNRNNAMALPIVGNSELVTHN